MWFPYEYNLIQRFRSMKEQISQVVAKYTTFWYHLMHIFYNDMQTLFTLQVIFGGTHWWIPLIKRQWYVALMFLVPWKYTKKESVIPYAMTPGLRNVSHIPPQRKVHGADMGPTGPCRPQVGPMLAPWTLLSGSFSKHLTLDCTVKYLPTTEERYHN